MPRGLQKSLQDYFTARFYFLILRVRFKVGFCSDECLLTVIPFTVLSTLSNLVGCPLGVPISYVIKMDVFGPHLFGIRFNFTACFSFLCITAVNCHIMQLFFACLPLY